MKRYVLKILWIIIFLMLSGCATAPFSYKPVTIDQQRKNSVDAAEAANNLDNTHIVKTSKLYYFPDDSNNLDNNHNTMENAMQYSFSKIVHQ